MTLPEAMAALEARGNAQTKKTYQNHGAPEPLFGVKVGDLKPLQKQIKQDYELALALYDTGNSDARYLGGAHNRRRPHDTRAAGPLGPHR